MVIKISRVDNGNEKKIVLSNPQAPDPILNFILCRFAGDCLTDTAYNVPLTEATPATSVSYTHLDVYKRQIYMAQAWYNKEK